ncbi:MAG: histidine phosphatase family protein [Acidobacteriota bacterium]
MRRILVLRHAKSDWDAAYGHDHDRPLKGRGKKAAALIGRFLEGSGQRPDHIHTSTAVRARDTVDRMIDAAGWTDLPVSASRGLYDTTADHLLEVVRGEGDEVASILLAGHEPTSSALVALLTGAVARMPTAAVACIELPIERWADVQPGRGTLVWLVTPKLLAAH